MQMTALQPADFDKLADIQPIEWYDPIPIHAFYFQASYCFAFKMEVNGQPIGVGTVIYHKEVAWLAHILVHKDHQRKGLGKAITSYLVDHALSKGINCIYLIATDMGAPVYSKLGFKVETEYIIYKDIELNLGHEVSKNIHPYTKQYKAEIFALDQSVTGECRIDSLCLNLNTGYVYLNNNKVIGFYLPNLGDGLIIASNEEAGQALMLMRLKGEHTTAIFPKDNKNAIGFMEVLKVKPSGFMKRMVYGIPRQVHYNKIYNRIGGNFG